MSSATTLHQRLLDAQKQNSQPMALAAFKEWQLANCYSPHVVQIYDAHSGTYRMQRVPCGKCYHCRETHVNSWVTRMYAHAEHFKNVYFITLTYRTLIGKSDIDKLALNKLSQAVWHLDSRNSTKRLGYSPCVLWKKHYQDFLKRLRKNTGINDLSYVLSGEYGHDYGRPHFHAILYTNSVLTKRDIERAWSISLFFHDKYGWQYKTNQSLQNGTPYWFRIGRVDFNDLVSNGTFNTDVKVKVDGQTFDAGRCFAYVAKYVTKNNDYNTSRLVLAYNRMWQKQHFVKLYDNEVSYNIANQWLRDHGVNKFSNSQLKQLSYEKIIAGDYKNLYQPFQTSRVLDFPCTFGFVEWLYPQDFADFREKFAPFVEFSRGTPIGSLYAVTHVQEFTQGVFNKPLLQVSGFVVPKYFINKAQNYIYGLRRVHPTESGVSYTLSNLPDLRRQFKCALQNAPAFVLPENHIRYYTQLCQNLRSSHAFVDLYTGEHILFVNYSGSIRANYYRYDRKFKLYVPTRNVPLSHFIDDFFDRSNRDYINYHQNLIKSKENEYFYSANKSLLEEAFAFDYTTLRHKFEDEQKKFLDERQKIYDDVHMYVE